MKMFINSFIVFLTDWIIVKKQKFSSFCYGPLGVLKKLWQMIGRKTVGTCFDIWFIVIKMPNIPFFQLCNYVVFFLSWLLFLILSVIVGGNKQFDYNTLGFEINDRYFIFVFWHFADKNMTR